VAEHEADRSPRDSIVLDIRGAHRRFGHRAALAGVDLRLRRGEILALLGPNGAGKTTLLGAISGRVSLDSGTIRIGTEGSHGTAARRRIGVVPQSVALYPALSARANLEVFGRLAGVMPGRIDAAVTEALAWCGLEARAGDPVKSLSGGMQRRLNIAAGALHDPDLLLLDEPTTGLDPTARGQIHAALRRLRSGGMAMLLATHDLHEAQDLADRVAILLDGRICALDTPGALIAAAFGDRKELNLLLEHDPDDRCRERLAAAGLQPTAIPRLWVGLTDDDFQDLAALRTHLREGGVPLQGLRVLEPGLHGVFLRMTGRDIEP
jgi:ABC-2 type transport system ATP-binding protein